MAERIGDEFHYLFKCNHPDIHVQRTKFLSEFYLHHMNAVNFNSLVNSRKISVLNISAKSVKFIPRFRKTVVLDITGNTSSLLCPFSFDFFDVVLICCICYFGFKDPPGLR